MTPFNDSKENTSKTEISDTEVLKKTIDNLKAEIILLNSRMAKLETEVNKLRELVAFQQRSLAIQKQAIEDVKSNSIDDFIAKF